MNKAVFLIGIGWILAGCSSTAVVVKQDAAYLDMYSGVSVVPAVVDNPHPACKERLTVARLDRPAALRVYVNTQTGEVCR